MTDLPPIFCAIDTPDMDRGLSLAAAMQKAGCGIKLGLEFFNAQGPDGVREIRQAYPEIPLFLDLKFHDIPNTVAGAVHAVCALEPQFLNVHASGGISMMQAAREAVDRAVGHFGIVAPKLLAVTILTSLDEEALAQAGFQTGLEDRVVQLARLTKSARLDGIVCSGQEIEPVRHACGSDFSLMVPGIRPAAAGTQDQKRVMTPEQALKAGANHLVIGRSITEAENPAEAAASILKTIETACSEIETAA